MGTCGGVGSAPQEQPFVAGNAEMLDDKAKQVLTDTAILLCGKERKDDYLARSVLTETVSDDRLIVGTDVACEDARPHVVGPRLRGNSHRCEPLGRDCVLTSLTTKHQAGRYVIRCREAAVHVDLQVLKWPNLDMRRAAKGAKRPLGRRLRGTGRPHVARRLLVHDVTVRLWLRSLSVLLILLGSLDRSQPRLAAFDPELVARHQWRGSF